MDLNLGLKIVLFKNEIFWYEKKINFFSSDLRMGISMPLDMPYLRVGISMPLSMPHLRVGISMPLDMPHLRVGISMPLSMPHLRVGIAMPLNMPLSAGLLAGLEFTSLG